MDCYVGDDTLASAKACERVRDQFVKITGEVMPSCSGLPQASDPCDSYNFITFPEAEYGLYRPSYV